MPDSRTRMRPVSPSFSPYFGHLGLDIRVRLGNGLIGDADVFQHLGVNLQGRSQLTERLLPGLSITSIIFSEVRMPSPVLAYLEKMMWPLCSPPMRAPLCCIYS